MSWDEIAHRDAVARAIWDAGESTTGREPYSWEYLLEKARHNPAPGDYIEIREGIYAIADALIAQFDMTRKAD